MLNVGVVLAVLLQLLANVYPLLLLLVQVLEGLIELVHSLLLQIELQFVEKAHLLTPVRLSHQMIVLLDLLCLLLKHV